MFHAKKPNFSKMNSLSVVMQKVINDWADEIKQKSYNELDMCNCCGQMSDQIVMPRKSFF